MKHAYLIMAHHEPKVLETLLELLDDKRNDLYVHIDRRADDLYYKMKNWKPQQAGFHLLEHREAPAWGDVSIVRAELQLFKTALLSPTPYAYYHLLSGMDLPLKTQDEIHAFFEQHAGKEFVYCAVDEAAMKMAQKRTQRHYLFLRSLCKRNAPVAHFFTTPFRKAVLGVEKLFHFHRFPEEETFYYGAQWASITHGFCEYLVAHAERICAMFRFTLCPDELYKQTLLMESPFAEHIYSTENSDKATQRFIDWSRGHSGHPHTFTLEDVDLLKGSTCLFARKFSGNDTALLRTWKEYLCSRT